MKFTKRVFLIMMLLILNVSMTGCMRQVAFGHCNYRIKTAECYTPTEQDADIIQSSFLAVDNLLNNLRDDPKIPLLYKRLWITTVADIDNLKRSSSLGRLLSEQFIARFSQLGYTVLETKLHDGLMVVPRTGEFILSRDYRAIGKAQRVDAVIAGTYAIARDTLYITLKMLDLQEGKVISSFAYTLPIGSDTEALLAQQSWWQL